MTPAILLCCLCVVYAFPVPQLPTHAQVDVTYTRSDRMIPMRDGVLLHTIFLIQSAPKRGPTVMVRTPYNATAYVTQAPLWTNQGYNVVLQDVRGRYMSQGTFACFHDAGLDGYDTMAYIAKQDFSDGNIVTEGASADGIAQYMQATQTPPWVKAQLVMVATPNLYRSSYPQGAYRQELFDGWLAGIGETWYQQVVHNHEPWSNYWSDVNIIPDYSKIIYPIIHLGGWYDIFVSDTLAAFQGVQSGGGVGSRGNNFLIMAPTGHCAGGAIKWPEAELAFPFAGDLALAVFKSVAPPPGTKARSKPVDLSAGNHTFFYVMGPGDAGSIGNFWAATEALPGNTPVGMYLGAGERLADTPGPAGSVEYEYDPARPIATHGGNNLLDPPCGPQLWNDIQIRRDVVRFSSGPLPAAIGLLGPLTAELYVSSSAVDTDFMAALLDVYPDNRAMLLQYGAFRMRWRDGNLTPQRMVPGQVYKIEVSLLDTCFMFNKGHTIRLLVFSSNTPHYSLNPNNGLLINQTGPAVVARNKIYFGGATPSRVVLPVVEPAAMPRASVEEIRAAIAAIAA